MSLPKHEERPRCQPQTHPRKRADHPRSYPALLRMLATSVDPASTWAKSARLRLAPPEPKRKNKPLCGAVCVLKAYIKQGTHTQPNTHKALSLPPPSAPEIARDSRVPGELWYGGVVAKRVSLPSPSSQNECLFFVVREVRTRTAEEIGGCVRRTSLKIHTPMRIV